MGLMGLTRHAQITRVNLQYLCDIVRKKLGMKQGLNCTGWFSTITVYFTFNALPPLTLFLSQYGIYTKPFLRLINYVSGISLLLLFQFMVGPYKLACF